MKDKTAYNGSGKLITGTLVSGIQRKRIGSNSFSTSVGDNGGKKSKSFTHSCTSIPNYKKLTSNNFAFASINANSLCGYDNAGVSGGASLSYNASNGVLTVTLWLKKDWMTNTGGNGGMSYAVDCFYTS